MEQKELLYHHIGSPGVSFSKEVNTQTGKDLFSGKIIPYKGTWLEFETDKNDF